MKNLRQFICTIVLLCFAACAKEPGNRNLHDSGANLFSFSTSREIEVNACYPLAHNTRVEIYTQNPLSIDDFKSYVKDESLTPLASGYTDGEGKFSIPLRVAAMTSEIYVYSPSIGAPVLLHGKIDNSNTVTLTEVSADKAATRAIADTKAYWKNWPDRTFTFRANPNRTWDAVGKPDYLAESTIEFDQKTLDIIDNTIPKGEALEIIFAQMEEIAISEDAHVTIHYVSNSSARRNTLAYYTYTGDIPSLAEINKSLTVLFPNVSQEALSPGDGVQLEYFDGNDWSEVFPAGSKIGFVVLVDSWDNGSVATKSKAVYSAKKGNRYDIPGMQSIQANTPQMAAFEANGYFILSFEDLPYYDNPSSPYKGDFSDNVFVLMADPITALPEIEEGKDPEKPDYGMEFNCKGILAFEDNWPYKGDYDMNDVVMKYNSKFYMSFDWDYTAFIDEFTFLNSGGQYKNGFGVEFSFAPDVIGSIELSATNGVDAPRLDTDASQKATLMFFENARDIPSGTVYRVKVVFKKPIFPMGYLRAPYNPFITINDNGSLRKETHLVNYAPTPKADLSFFGYGHDLSEPDRGIYYVSDAKYPFAIDITDAEDYTIPAEKQPIDQVYPDFIKWVNSNGKEYTDWYKR